MKPGAAKKRALISLLAMMIVALGAGLAACTKVPLRENRAEFDLSSAHWFENEKTQYVFFSVRGLRPGQAALSWPSLFELKIEGGSPRKTDEFAGLPGRDGFARLDFSKAVHHHRLVACGDGRLCGSLSFHAERPPTSFQLRFRYHQDSALGPVRTLGNSVHPAGDKTNSQSALVYGVFNAANDRLQIVVHDNFGSPDSEQIKQYGMARDFRIDSVRLVDLKTEDEMKLAADSGSDFLFPAEACASRSSSAATSDAREIARGRVHRFTGIRSWFPDALDPLDVRGAACFRVQSIDQRGAIVNAAAAVARRNPVLQNETLAIRSPLRPALKIPLILAFCQGPPASAPVPSGKFLDYQRFILGIPAQTPVDLCFSVGDEDRFVEALDHQITKKLAAARASNPARQDFILTVAINQDLPPIFRRFHEIIAETIRKKVNEELRLVSPRLTGAFIYDSQALELRPFKLGPGMIWCPRLQPKTDAPTGPGANRGTFDPDLAASANCTPFFAGDVTFGPLKVLIPLRPFPTLRNFVDYSKDHGDRGRSYNPQLIVQAVATNEASMSDGSSYTFFDHERLSVEAGSGVKFCLERDEDAVIPNLVFRESGSASSGSGGGSGGDGPDSTGQRPVVTYDQVRPLLLGDGPQRTLDVGIYWNYPFVGGIAYDVPLQGKVLGYIPISFSRRRADSLGDGKWRRKVWQVGPLLQKCVRFCSHPLFDESGVYQISQNWRSNSNCPTPKVPEP